MEDGVGIAEDILGPEGFFQIPFAVFDELQP